jgi:hypothetical protein
MLRCWSGGGRRLLDRTFHRDSQVTPLRPLGKTNHPLALLRCSLLFRLLFSEVTGWIPGETPMGIDCRYSGGWAGDKQR